MFNLTEKDKQIMVQVAFKGAVDILSRNGEYQALLAGDENERNGARGWFTALCVELEDVLFERVKTITHMAPEQAMPALQAAFPGAEPQQPQNPYVQAAMAPPVPQQQFYAPQAPVPAPTQFMPPQAAYAPPPQQQGYGAPQNGQRSMSDAEQWEDLLRNPANWRDVRSQKQGPSSPDFVHAWMKNGKGKDLALWLDGKFNKPPVHIVQQLAMQGRI